MADAMHHMFVHRLTWRRVDADTSHSILHCQVLWPLAGETGPEGHPSGGEHAVMNQPRACTHTCRLPTGAVTGCVLNPPGLSTPLLPLCLPVGTDPRITAPLLKPAVVAGLLDAGAMVTDVGLSTTPAMFYSIIAPGED